VSDSTTQYCSGYDLWNNIFYS